MVWQAALMLLATQEAAPLPDLLICNGSTVAPVTTGSTNAVVTDNRGNIITGRATDSEVREVRATVQFRLNGDDPRMNLPRALQPELASSKGGWFRIKDLVVTDDFVRGKVVLNFLSSTRFEIDRRTGILTSEGGFQGACQSVDTTDRKF